jgi:endonuclease/exonuclease/phosphatase family metal-dependent hydrolase
MSARPLRLLTLNIAHGRGLSTYQGFHRARGIERNLLRVARLLKREAADVVALQEVDEDSHWNQRIHLLDFLKAEACYPHSHLGVHNRRGGRLPLAYGNGLLSRFPIEHADHQAFGSAEIGEKGFLYTELTLPDGHLPIVNLHLDYKSRLRRIEQIERLIVFLEERHAQKGNEGYLSPVVCGDFNSRSGKPNDAVAHLFKYLEDQCAYQIYPKNGRTFPSLLPIHGLDFILVPPSYKVMSCEILRCYVSDHRPVVVDLEILNKLK